MLQAVDDALPRQVGSRARMPPLLLRYAAFARRHAAALEALETVVQARAPLCYNYRSLC